MAGSLDEGQVGAVQAVNVDREAPRLARVQQEDPFVAHGVVSAEVHAIAPARMAAGMANLLGSAQALAAGC